MSRKGICRHARTVTASLHCNETTRNRVVTAVRALFCADLVRGHQGTVLPAQNGTLVDEYFINNYPPQERQGRRAHSRQRRRREDVTCNSDRGEGRSEDKVEGNVGRERRARKGRSTPRESEGWCGKEVVEMSRYGVAHACSCSRGICVRIWYEDRA